MTDRLIEVTRKMVIASCAPICIALLSSKMLISPDKLNNLCITVLWTETVTSRCYVNKQINVTLL